MHPKDAAGIANSVDPDQTAPLGAVWSGSALFAQTYLSENLRSYYGILILIGRFCPKWANIGSFVQNREIIAVLRRLILQMCMCSHPVGLDVWFLVGPFFYFHTLCVRTAKALARLREYAGSPEPLLVAYVISTIISWAGSYMFTHTSFFCEISWFVFLWPWPTVLSHLNKTKYTSSLQPLALFLSCTFFLAHPYAVINSKRTTIFCVNDTSLNGSFV